MRANAFDPSTEYLRYYYLLWLTVHRVNDVFDHLFTEVRRHLSRALCLALIFSLLSTTLPNAPQTIIGLVSDISTSLNFWFHQSGWDASLRRAFSGQEGPDLKSQERQGDRDARVTRIEIYPGDVTIQGEEHVAFTTAAFYRDGNPIGGVHVKWSCQDEGRGIPARVSQRGDFVATVTGKFKVTAE